MNSKGELATLREKWASILLDTTELTLQQEKREKHFA